MKFNIIKNNLKITHFVLSLSLLIGCNDNEATDKVVHDPSQPVEITSFEPKEGVARTRFFIHGKNFGSNINDVKVKIGGEFAGVIGCNGEQIYCMVPPGAFEGTVEVAIGENSEPVIAQEKFKYIPAPKVGTVVGYVDETGKVEAKDGPFEEAGFTGPAWLAVDPKDKNKMYVNDGGEWWGNSIREIDFSKREVSTLLTKGQGNWDNIRCFTFTISGDTMLIVNRQNAEGSIGISYTTRANGFKKPQPLIYDRGVFGVTVHPVNGEVYYVSRFSGDLKRYDWKTKKTTTIMNIGGSDAAYVPFFHPSGDYMYITFSNWKTILRMDYNWDKKTLYSSYSTLCGEHKQQGWVDGQGTNARLGNPSQGVFVENEDGDYDFYFADGYAHAIRYVTPAGYVHTYAGRGSQGVNNNPQGYVDGDLRQEARFNYPSGLIYDGENEIFYIGDLYNYRIRDIKKNE